MIASIVVIVPRPSIVLSVGRQMAEASAVYVVVYVRLCIGIVVTAWCSSAHVGPTLEEIHPTCTRSRVVRRCSVPRCRLESYRCFAHDGSVRVCQLVLWYWWMVRVSVVMDVVVSGPWLRCALEIVSSASRMEGGVQLFRTRSGLASGTGRTSAACKCTWLEGGVIARCRVRCVGAG